MPKSGWTNKMVSDLRKCAEMAKEKENKDVGLLFCSVLEAEWRHLYPRSKFDRHFLLRKYDNLEGNDIARPVEKTFQNEGKQNGQNHVEMAETGNDQEVNFAWTLKRLEDLEKCKENALKTQDEMKKRFNAKMSYMKVMHKEWLKLYPNSTHSANSLQSRLWLYQKQKKVSQNRKKATEELVHTNEHSEDEEEVKQSAGKTIWTPEMLHDLEKCYNEALKIQEDSKKNDSCVSYMTVMLAEWNKLYPESTLSAKNLHARLWIYQKEKSSTCKHESGDSNHDEVNTKKKATDPYEGDLKDETKPTLKDLAAPLFFPKGGDEKTPKKTWLPEHANMPQDQGMLYSMRVFGQRHAAKPLFDGICYNCGMMLFGRVSEGHKFLVRKDALGTDQAPVVSLYDDPPTLSFEKSEVQWYSCKLCSKGLRQLLPCVDPETGLQKVPKEVGNLKSPYERGQVSLCGLFSTTLKRADPFRKIWPHFSGEVNILHKLNRHYYGMYGFLVAKEKPVKEEGSHQIIAAALKWLRCNNPLYANFFSNYETLYRFRPDNPLSVAFAHGVRDAKGGSLEEQLGKETAALVVPFSEDRNAPQIHECEDVAGIQHPERKTPQDVTNAEREILSTAKVTYLDPNLEAKAWPHLFPYGTGSWAYGLGLTPTEYCKLRLLNYGNRWRKDPQWAFFWFDRLTKSRIFYYNRARKARRTGRDKPLTSEKIKGESPYDVYGTEVPNTIPGSKGYWSSRLLDVLAMSRELGKPDFFVTLTQNDAWPELQAHITRGAGETAEGLEFDESLPEHMSQDPAMEFPTETVVAFQKRFQLFREKVLEDANGPLGRVNDYWWRIEYQRRGALHVHMVVWCEPDTIPEDAVIAEFPRSEDVDDQFTQACRSYVQKYQIHGKCVPERCFKGPGGKVLDHCKYGFPFGVEENDRPDESGMRMLYQRRCKEDSRVVPYNLPILLLMGAHVNIQRVTSGGWELYLAKYVAKAEPSFDMKLPEQTSDPERYLRTRVPTSNIASGGNRYLLSAYFRRPVLNIASVAQCHEE